MYVIVNNSNWKSSDIRNQQTIEDHNEAGDT